jgi:hypothetical protein
MERPPESLKPFANRIAGAVSSGEAPEMIRLLRLSGFLGGASGIAGIDAGDIFAPPPPDSGHIGIWEQRVENGRTCFVRRIEMMHEWQFWANLGRIEPKEAGRARIVLIGESVARGYLYDPQFTPAMALEVILKPQFPGGVEVVDLARTNLAHQVRELAVGALQLEPDAVVIFSGNNWGLAFPGPSEIAEIDEALDKEGIAGAKHFSETQIGSKARRVVSDIASAYARAAVPLVWVVPEFNLGDWRDLVTNAPHLPSGRNRDWLALMDEAQAALRDGETARAEASALAVVEADGGVCVAGLYVLAECRRRAGDADGERRFLEMARDAVSWDLSRRPIPRPYSVTQQAVREEGVRYGNQIVDLPALFEEYLDGAIPDRRLFLDYCHLTSEGIRVAMAATASCLLRALRGSDLPWYTLDSAHVAPSARIEAEASFLAAIVNGHWSPSSEVVRYYCERALSLSPHVSDLMLDYLELQTRSLVPMRMGGAEERIARLGSPLIQHYLLRLNEKRLDRLLLSAIAEALDTAGLDGSGRLAGLRREEHSVAVRDTDLLDYYYCSSADQPQEAAWRTPTGEKRYRHEAEFYKAYSGESRFVFVGEAGRPVRLAITCRLPPHAPPAAHLSVELNGRPQAVLDASRSWGSWELAAAAEAVRDGVNEVTLRWPTPEFPGDAALDSVRLELCEGKFPEFYPVFGEIHSFTASSDTPGRSGSAQTSG